MGPDVGTGRSVGLLVVGAHTPIPMPTMRHWGNDRSANELEEEPVVENRGRAREREISPEFNSLFPKEQLMDYDKCPTALP